MHIDARSYYSFHDGVSSPAELCAHGAELGFTEVGLADLDGTYGLIHMYKAAAKCGVKPVLGIALTDSTGSADFSPRAAGPTAVSGLASLPANHSGSADFSPHGAGGGVEPSPAGMLVEVGGRGAAGTGSNNRQDAGALREDGGRSAAATGTEPAVWVYAQDREGYSELCRLAALRQGCGDAGASGEKVGGAGAAGTRSLADTAVGPTSGQGRPPHWDLIRALLAHTHHCFVVSRRADVLSALAPRLGPGRVFVRLDADYGPAGRARQIEQLKLAARLNLRPVACTDVRFLRPQDQVVHHVLKAIGQNATLYTAQGVRPRDHYFSAPTELAGYYYNCPEALQNTRALAQRCNVDFELGRWVFPRYELRGGAEPRVALGQLCQRGLSWRGVRDTAGTYAARLEMELRVIEELGYSSYFLAVYDIVREAKRRRIPHVGRGSAANSLVSYLLGLTPVDPLRYDMYFERFLNPQRTSPPDIDIDFSWKRRDEILGYVYERWGHERVAMISTHVTFRARSALREVAKVFGLGDAEISTVSKFLPHISASSLGTAQREFAELRGVDLHSEPYCHVLPLAGRLDGKPRHLGIHCGGVVIAPGRVTDYTGLQRAAKGFVVTQYDMFPVEDVGLIKIDLLGNRSLGVLEDALAVIEGSAPSAPACDPTGPGATGQGPGEGTGNREQGTEKTGTGGPRAGDLAVGPTAVSAVGAAHGPPAGRPWASPTNCRQDAGAPNIRRQISNWETLATDPATVALIRAGLTIGCFYIESPGMRQLLRRLRTQTFLDLTAASSVIRPGVAESGMMQEYIRRVRGEAPHAPSHPRLIEIMPETHGVMIYQEDVIKVAHRVAGMSLADADLLRRAMSGKMRSQQAMNQLRERFIAGCEQNSLDLASALEIWRQIASFAGYSFCKAHSASFATLSFQVAWLKAHHPAVFMAAVLSNGGGFYGPRAYLSECERLGLRVLTPDVNYSRMEFTAEIFGTGGPRAADQASFVGAAYMPPGSSASAPACDPTGPWEGTGNREQGTVGRASLPAIDLEGGQRRPPSSPGGAGVSPVISQKNVGGTGAAGTGRLADTAVGPTGGRGGPPQQDTGAPREGSGQGRPLSNTRPPSNTPDAVRVGLSLLKGVSVALLERIVHEREHGGPYRSLPSFIRRTRPGERDLGVLIRAGALDSLGLTRPELLWLAQMERKAALRTGDMTSRAKGQGPRARQGIGNREQGTEKSGSADFSPRPVGRASLPADRSGSGGFQPPKEPERQRLQTAATKTAPPAEQPPERRRSQTAATKATPQPLPFDERERIDDFRARVGATLDDYDELKLCELELTHLGLLVRRHPLTLYQHLVSGVISARDLPRYAGKWVRLLGWCIATKRVDLTRRQGVRDTLELLAEHADMPEQSEMDGSFEEEREGTAEDLGIVLRGRGSAGLRGTGGPRAADISVGRTAVSTNNQGTGNREQGTAKTGTGGPRAADNYGSAGFNPRGAGGGVETPPTGDFAPTRRAMKFMSMEDLTGTYEVTLFADAYARFAPLTRYAGPFLVTGRVEEQFDTYTVNATDLRLLRLDDDGSALAPPSSARSQSIRSAGRAKGGG